MVFSYFNCILPTDFRGAFTLFHIIKKNLLYLMNFILVVFILDLIILGQDIFSVAVQSYWTCGVPQLTQIFHSIQSLVHRAEYYTGICGNICTPRLTSRQHLCIFAKIFVRKITYASISVIYIIWTRGVFRVCKGCAQ